MNWKYEWVQDLPCDVYDVLVAMLTKEAEQQQRID